MFSLHELTRDFERRVIPEFVAEREIRTVLEKNPLAFWKGLFNMIGAGFVCRCGRPGTIRRIAGISQLISTCTPCRSFSILVSGIDVPKTFADDYSEEPIATFDGWRCIQPLNVFVACGTAKLLSSAEVEEWLQGLLKDAVDHPYHRSKLIEAILEKEIHG